jgi:hypothetical protein
MEQHQGIGVVVAAEGAPNQVVDVTARFERQRVRYLL